MGPKSASELPEIPSKKRKSSDTYFRLTPLSENDSVKSYPSTRKPGQRESASIPTGGWRQKGIIGIVGSAMNEEEKVQRERERKKARLNVVANRVEVIAEKVAAGIKAAAVAGVAAGAGVGINIKREGHEEEEERGRIVGVMRVDDTGDVDVDLDMDKVQKDSEDVEVRAGREEVVGKDQEVEAVMEIDVEEEQDDDEEEAIWITRPRTKRKSATLTARYPESTRTTSPIPRGQASSPSQDSTIDISDEEMTEDEDEDEVIITPTPTGTSIHTVSATTEEEDDNFPPLEDYRGIFDPPTEPYQKLNFPKMRKPKTVVEKLQDVVADWEKLVEKYKNLGPGNGNEDLLKHSSKRLQAHREELQRAIEEEPLLPPYKEGRIAVLKGCLERFIVPEEIVNVKAAIRAFEDGVLGNDMEEWTVFYNGKIVDKMNSQHELLWSVRQPLYEEIYGKPGSIWIEPPAYHVSKACALLWEKQFVSGAHWYVKQNIRLPWYSDPRRAVQFDFLLDSGATDPSLYQSDLDDLGMVWENCPHVATKTVRTANGLVQEDFYPIFINHIDPQTQKSLYLPMDSIASVHQKKPVTGRRIEEERLSGLDMWRYLYVASEPSTGILSYASKWGDIKIRSDINPGNTLTPRAWYTVSYDDDGTKHVSESVVDLANRRPRLLNPQGERWVHFKPYKYQYGADTRSPPPKVGYIPGHRVHPPTPDDIRKQRNLYWNLGRVYRDNRPAIKRTRNPQTKRLPGRDDPFKDSDATNPKPDNSYQYLEPDEVRLAPIGPLMNPPQNQTGVLYWDDGLPEEARRVGAPRLVLQLAKGKGDKTEFMELPRGTDYIAMGIEYETRARDKQYGRKKSDAEAQKANCAKGGARVTIDDVRRPVYWKKGA